MFDNFTQIPHSDNEASQMMSALNEITDAFQNIVPNNTYNINWFTNYAMINVGYLLTVMNALTATKDHMSWTEYFAADSSYFESKYKLRNNFGIIINEDASTRFNASRFEDAVYLENAEEFLKQTPHHFLKIFTNPLNSILYVWTNKPLTADTLYKLFSIEVSLHNKENKLITDFLKYLVDDDLENAKKLLTDFFTSDVILEREFNVFKQCLIKSNSRQIRNLEQNIDAKRRSIRDYENEIASLATQIREMNENLIFLKYMQTGDDDQKLFFKHLKKIPYLKSFQGNAATGTIHLEYEAPLIYFNEFPAEKMINQAARPHIQKEIIKAIIGRKYELMTKCALQFNTETFSISSADIQNGSKLLKHPHISRYNCFGNHRQAIYESAETGNYIGAIEQITQAVLNLNFYDNCVIDSMCSTLMQSMNSLKTWRNKETGEMISTNELIERNDYYEET